MLENLKCTKRNQGKSTQTSGDKYYITLTRKDNGKSINFTFHDNYLNKSKLEDFVYAIVSDCSAYESCSSVEMFKNMFGYEDYEEAEKVYKACKKTSDKVHKIFTTEELEWLYDPFLTNY